MTELLAGAVAVSVAVTASGGVLLGRLLSYRTSESPTDSQPVEISVERYRVLTGLASTKDLEFLRKQPGFTRELEGKFRRDQRRIYRCYLRELASDFQRLHARARVVVSHAPEQHADLVGILFRQQLTFWRSLAVVEMRLLLSAAGVPSVDLGAMLGSVDELRTALARANALSATA